MKKSKRLIRDFIATGCAAALALGGAAPAFAFNNQAYDVPTAETPIINSDGYRYVSAVGQHGSAVVGEYAGMNALVNEIFATPGNGTNTSDYMYNPYMGIFGTSANENPDPYTANLMYNWYVQANPQSQLQKSNNAMVNMLFTSSKGSSILNDTSVNENGESLTLANRPDVLTVNPTAANSFDEQIKAINEKDRVKASDTYVGDAKYAPITATYDESNMITQVANMWRHAQAAVKVEENSAAAGVKVVSRYGDSLDTAYRYELYTKGSILYTLSQLKENGGKVEKKTVAFVKGISGDTKDATVTLYGEPDPSTSREMAHHIECTVATANNLANVLDPTLERGWKDGKSPKPTVTCTIADLAKADVIILADPDNMAYNLNGLKEDGTFVGASWVKSDENGTAENDWGQSATRSATDTAGNKYYKNRFWGPQASTGTMVDYIKAALKDEGSKEAAALAEKNILSCVQEGSSSSDGGSTEAMSQYGIINAFIYPEIASGVNQYAWWLDNIAHIKTDKVAGMVRILAQDMTLAEGAKLSDVDGWSFAKSEAIEDTYEAGMKFYAANKDAIDNKYPWLETSEEFDAYAATYAKNRAERQKANGPAAQKIAKVTPTSKTLHGLKSKKLKKNQTFTLKATGAKTAVTFAKANTAGGSKIKVASSGKVTVKKGLKKGTYTVKVKATAKTSAKYKKATKTVNVKIKVAK